jgi:hypothetical protein
MGDGPYDKDLGTPYLARIPSFSVFSHLVAPTLSGRKANAKVATQAPRKAIELFSDRVGVKDAFLHRFEFLSEKKICKRLQMNRLSGGAGEIRTGGTSNGPSQTGQTPSSSATMQAGQWEFVATPNTSQPVYLEVNLTGSNAAIGSTVFNTSLFQFGGGIGGEFSDCGNWQTNNQVTNGSFSGTLSSPGSTAPLNQVTYAGTLASNGQTVTSGSYSAPDSTLCSLASNNSTGTFTGYIVASLNGTFTGTLNGSNGADQISIQVSQDGNFGITASGTASQAGLTTTLSVTPAGSVSDNTGGYSNVIGATLQGSGTSTNVNGSRTFQFLGHFNPAGTQISIVLFGQATETGTLTKQ